VTASLAPAAQLRLLSVARCRLDGLQQNASEFAAHPYLRIQTHPSDGFAVSDRSDGDM
jgi:hypothetical protein